MKITLTIPDSSVPAVQARVDKYNAGSGQPSITIEQWRQLQSDEQTAQEVAQFSASLLDLMRPMGAEIAAAAGGDVAKITAALDAGKTAALKTLS
jgi:hypothetical protein